MSCFKDGNECPYRKSCKNKAEDGSCYKICPIFHEINSLFEYANIPRLYLQPFLLYPGEYDSDNYYTLAHIKKNIEELVQKGFNLYIQSDKKQNGKTSWAIKILQNYLHYSILRHNSENKGLYVDTTKYLKDLKLSFDDYDKNLRSFQKDLEEVQLVIWDNIDEMKLSDFDRAYIKQIIKSRLSNGRSNIFVGNNSGNKLSIMIGEDLKYYVENNSTVVSLFSERGDK